MLALHQKLSAATIPADKQLYQRQIEAADRQIDGLGPARSEQVRVVWVDGGGDWDRRGRVRGMVG